jgi:arylsulfatase A-like enzyme
MPRSKFVAALFFLLATTHSMANGQDQPNFLWIMSEDNSKHYLKMFDDAGTATPNIEKMAAHGVTFDRAFSNAPVCSVARTTLITMVYAPRLGTQFHRRIKTATMPDGWKMFPAFLRNGGYYTTNNSKKDYNAVESNDVWDASSAKAHWRNRPDDKPFFHVQTYTDSHESSLHFKQDWVDNPDNITDPASIQLAPYHPDTPLFRLTYARYHDRIQVIDGKVGKLLEQLAEDGVLEDTFVFYFGDHGGVLPRGKGYVNESGLHVPLVVRVPEKWKDRSPFPQGTRTKGFVEFVDFGPTVLQLAGVEIPKYVNGKPFLGPGVTADEVNARNETFGYADRMDEKYDFCRSLRRGKWKYIRNYQAIYPDGLQNNYRYINLAWKQWREMNRAGKLNPAQSAFFEPKPAEQLFDVLADPHEVNDLASDPGHREKLLELRTELTEQVKALPDLSFYPESELVDNALDDPIAFGKRHQASIAKYVDVANLALLPVNEALPKLELSIKSNDPIERYWAYTVCSIFGEQAGSFSNHAKQSADNDSDLLVRLRAAEFLGLTKNRDPVPTIREIVKASNSPVINLIALQTLVHFKDGPFDYDTTIDTESVKSIDDQVMRRIGYLDGLPEAEIRKRMREIMQKRRSKAKSKRK